MARRLAHLTPEEGNRAMKWSQLRDLNSRPAQCKSVGFTLGAAGKTAAD